MGGQLTQQKEVQLYFTLTIVSTVECVEELLAIKLQVQMPLNDLIIIIEI